LVEAGIDFTDQEDVVPISPKALEQRISRLLQEIAAMLGAAAGAEQPSSLPRIVLAGRPNSGKSTLFNALLGRSRAMTSPIAGTTRDAIVEELDLSRKVPCATSVLLVDLAGLEVGANAIDRAAQEQAEREIAQADAILLCDPTGRFDFPLPGDAARPPVPTVRVRTKADLPVGHSISATVEVCALDGWNLGVLLRAIADAAAAARGTSTWLIPRHRRTLNAAARSLAQARGLANLDAHARSLRSPEVIAGHLREAVENLGELVGRIFPDDIIGRIFATFCVGK
jgi:tRNA modification GTPase